MSSSYYVTTINNKDFVVKYNVALDIFVIRTFPILRKSYDLVHVPRLRGAYRILSSKDRHSLGYFFSSTQGLYASLNALFPRKSSYASLPDKIVDLCHEHGIPIS